MNRSSKRGWAMRLMPRGIPIIAVILLVGCMQAMPTDPALREASGTFGVSRPSATPPLEVYEYALPAPLERMPPLLKNRPRQSHRSRSLLRNRPRQSHRSRSRLHRCLCRPPPSQR